MRNRGSASESLARGTRAVDPQGEEVEVVGTPKGMGPDQVIAQHRLRWFEERPRQQVYRRRDLQPLERDN